MKTIKTILPLGEIVEIKTLPNGRTVVVQEIMEECKNENIFCEDDFILIEAEKLSITDEFMKWKPKTEKEENLRMLIMEAICFGVKNFYRPRYDPSFTDERTDICFEAGKNPAVGKTYRWWEKTAKNYMPKRCSRLGTRREYGAFLGVLIKKLVEAGQTLEWSWNAVCNDSSELGHYWNSNDAKHCFELTGSRCVCDFYDLSNTTKMFSHDDEGKGFFLASGGCMGDSKNHTLATLGYSTAYDDNYYGTVGWIVIS